MAISVEEIKSLTTSIDEGQNFTLINSIKKAPVKVNSLYNLVEGFLNNEPMPLLLKKNKIKKISNKTRDAHVISLGGDYNYRNLFEAQGYICTDRHLTIDRVYAEYTSGNVFTSSHYTEKYENVDNKKNIVVHVYFNTQGRRIYTQAKSLENGAAIIVDYALENNIQINSFPAVELLNILLDEKIERYKKAIERADKIQQELEAMSRFQNSDSRKKFIRYAERFKKEVNIINLYNDFEVDRRGALIEKICNSFNSNFHDVLLNPRPQLTISEESDKNDVQSNVEGIQIQDHKNGKKERKRNQLQQEKPFYKDHIFQLEKKLKELSEKFTAFLLLKNKDMVESHQLSIDLKCLCAELKLYYSLSDNGQEETRKNIDRIDEIEKKSAQLPNAISSLKEYALAGEIEKFKPLFNVIKDKVSHDLCHALVTKVIEDKDDQKLMQRRIEVCDFLFENSAYYRSYILVLCHKVFISWHIENCEYVVTIPARVAIIDKNLNAFSMLLRHGFDPNSTGILSQEGGIPILRLLISWGVGREYIELLLDYGAMIDNPRFISAEAYRLNSQLENSENYDKDFLKEKIKFAIKNQVLVKLPFDRCLANIGRIKWEVLLAAMRIQSFQLVPVLMKRSSLEGVVIVFAMCVHFLRTDISIYFSVSPEEPEVGFPNDHRAKIKDTVKAKLHSSPEKNKFFQFILYATDIKNNSSGLSSIKAMCDFLKEKCKMDPKRVQIAIKELKEIPLSDKYPGSNDRDIYMASLFLMANKYDLTKDDLLEAINCFHKRFLLLESEDTTEVIKNIEQIKNNSPLLFLAKGEETSIKTAIEKIISDIEEKTKQRKNNNKLIKDQSKAAQVFLPGYGGVSQNSEIEPNKNAIAVVEKNTSGDEKVKNQVKL